MTDVHSESWWLDFEIRVDATEVPLTIKDITLEIKEISLKRDQRLSPEDFEKAKQALLGDPENKTPIKMQVYTAKGWMVYTLEVPDLEEVGWHELPNVIALEGPTRFRDVVALAKSRYEVRCGFLSPQIHRMPQVLINDLKRSL